MADTPNTFSTLNGLFKVVYADKLLELIPNFAILQQKIPFAPADKQLGNYYSQPVQLASEGGFTYNGEAGSVVTLNDAIAGATKEAQVKGSELILKTQLAYTALSRAASQGQRSFKRVTAFKVEDMNNSTRKRLEIAMLYGQKGIGTVSANSSGVLTITDASWAAGIWVGTEGHILQAYATDLSTQHNGDLTISAVDTDAKTVTVTGTSAAVVATDVLFFKGANSAGTFNEMVGLQKIIQNSTTLFNISAATYSLWKGNSISSVGELTFAKLQDYVTRAVNKGLMDDVTVLLNPRVWSKLNSDQAALRMLDGSYSSTKAENGVEAITFYGVNGKMEIISHPFVKEGDGFILPLGIVKRIGSVDLTFGVPGMDEQFFTLVSGKNAVELQCMCDQAVFLEKPAQAVFITGITLS